MQAIARSAHTWYGVAEAASRIPAGSRVPGITGADEVLDAAPRGHDTGPGRALAVSDARASGGRAHAGTRRREDARARNARSGRLRQLSQVHRHDEEVVRIAVAIAVSAAGRRTACVGERAPPVVAFETQERYRVGPHTVRHPGIARLEAARADGLAEVEERVRPAIIDLEDVVERVAVAVQIAACDRLACAERHQFPSRLAPEHEVLRRRRRNRCAGPHQEPARSRIVYL